MTKSENEAPHIALFPAAGMGHLIPFLRLAAVLDSRGCAATIITAEPPVSAAESDYLSGFFALHPHIKRLPLKLVPYEKSGLKNDDPFFIQMEGIANSVHLLQPLLSSLSPPLSAAVVDLPILSRLSDLPIPLYTLITTSARFFSVMNRISHLATHSNAQLDHPDHVEIPVLGSIPLSSIPPPLLDPNTFFAAVTTTNMASVPKLRGVLINTFTWLESRAVDALGRNGVEHILPIGPLQPFQTGESLQLPWLDKQAPRTVVYISFGSRTAMSRDQIREVAAALEMSGCLFLWVLKGSKVDKEDKGEIEEMVDAAFLERTKAKGVVYKRWVEQDQILAHPAVGGFVSHCGWNSVTEAAAAGVPVLAWPMHGDQRVNAEVVEEMGLGIWDREWGWGGQRLIRRDEIAEKLTALMGDKKLRATAKEVREKALQAREIEGSSETSLQGLIQSLKSKRSLVFLPSGMGNSTPFFRLAVGVASCNCRVTLINVQPQDVDPELANQPGVAVLDFEMQADADASISDSFIARVTTINRALYQLNPILTSLQASAIFTDFAIAATLAQISGDLNIPLYIVSSTSAQFLAVVANIPLLLSQDSKVFSNSSAKCSSTPQS